MTDHGTQLVIWILTRRKKVMIIRNGEDAVIHDWDRDIELMQEPHKPITLNLAKLIAAEGIEC